MAFRRWRRHRGDTRYEEGGVHTKGQHGPDPSHSVRGSGSTLRRSQAHRCAASDGAVHSRTERRRDGTTTDCMCCAVRASVFSRSALCVYVCVHVAAIRRTMRRRWRFGRTHTCMRHWLRKRSMIHVERRCQHAGCVRSVAWTRSFAGLGQQDRSGPPYLRRRCSSPPTCVIFAPRPRPMASMVSMARPAQQVQAQAQAMQAQAMQARKLAQSHAVAGRLRTCCWVHSLDP